MILNRKGRVMFKVSGCKMIYGLISLLFCCKLAYSQIPNNGFENWSSPNGYLIPDSWGNLNVITNTSGIYTATRWNPGMVGSYYIDLTSRAVPGRGIVPGIITSGLIDTVTYKPVTGFAYSARPSALKGKWQYMGFGADQGFIEIVFTKWNTGTNARDTIGYVKQILSGMEMSWTNMYIPISYSAPGAPDTCVIVISSSGDSPEEESFIYLDELFFDGFTGVEELTESSLVIYPNPASDFIEIQFKSNEFVGNLISITDVMGKIVATKEIYSNKEIINVADFASGVYFVNIEINKKVNQYKLNIKH